MHGEAEFRSNQCSCGRCARLPFPVWLIRLHGSLGNPRRACNVSDASLSCAPFYDPLQEASHVENDESLQDAARLSRRHRGRCPLATS